MDREKKLGIIFIIIGLLIPLAVLPFVSGFSKDKGFYDNFMKVGIDIRNDTKDNSPAHTQGAESKTGTTSLMPKQIPFRFFLVPTVILIYIGIIRIERSRRKNTTTN